MPKCPIALCVPCIFKQCSLGYNGSVSLHRLQIIYRVQVPAVIKDTNHQVAPMCVLVLVMSIFTLTKRSSESLTVQIYGEKNPYTRRCNTSRRVGSFIVVLILSKLHITQLGINAILINSNHFRAIFSKLNIV